MCAPPQETDGAYRTADVLGALGGESATSSKTDIPPPPPDAGPPPVPPTRLAPPRDEGDGRLGITRGWQALRGGGGGAPGRGQGGGGVQHVQSLTPQRLDSCARTTVGTQPTVDDGWRLSNGGVTGG